MNTHYFKEKLEEEEAILAEELSRLGVQDPITGNWIARIKDEDNEPNPDSIDAGDLDEDFELTTDILQTLDTRYKDVLLALQKIESGTFGICEVSGKPIEEERLMANPAAKTCKDHI